MKICLLALTALAAQAISPPQVLDAESGVTVGSMDVSGTPEAVYALLADPSRWAKTFSDVTAARLVNGQSSKATLELTSRAFRHDVTADMVLQPQVGVSWVATAGPPGARIEQSWRLVPLKDSRGTHVEVRLRASIGGMASLLFPEFRLRSMRRDKVRQDLLDLASAL